MDIYGKEIIPRLVLSVFFVLPSLLIPWAAVVGTNRNQKTPFFCKKLIYDKKFFIFISWVFGSFLFPKGRNIFVLILFFSEAL